MLTKFLTSKGSGWLSIISILAIIGGGVWFWSELKEFGSLKERAATLEKDLSEKRAELEYLKNSIQRKQTTLVAQQKETNSLLQNATRLRQEIEEARNEAPEDYLNCRDVIVPERLRFGPSRENSER